jgi:hypothetical protein
VEATILHVYHNSDGVSPAFPETTAAYTQACSTGRPVDAEGACTSAGAPLALFSPAVTALLALATTVLMLAL